MKYTRVENIEFYTALKQGKLPKRLMSRSVWEQHIFLDLIPALGLHPFYISWLQGLQPVDGVGFRIGPDVPIVETSLAVSKNESNEPNDNLINSFMREMAQALANKTHPYEEIFAVLLDGFYTFQHKHYKNMSTLH